jgi:carotenoid cleavage dioxygenase-like enzyme
VYRAHERRSDLLCLDAQSLETVAVAHLPHAVPPGFHGSFVPRVDA